MSGVIDIALERDGHDQPWGFRLQGGHDVGMPLSIQRALCGTPSEGVLKKGDVLLKIGRTDAKSLSHQQAADLFTNTGNQIVIQIKRSGVTTNTTTSKPVAPPQPVPVAGGVALPGMTSFSQGRSQDTLLLNLPKTRGATKPQPSSTQHSTTAPLSLTIQNQPYRTSPLIQPSAKTEVGPGSATHLKMQADYLTGAKEAVDHKPSEYTMKHKVQTGTAKFQISFKGSERKSSGLENYKTEPKISLIGLRFPIWKDMFKAPTSRNKRIMDLENNRKTVKIDLNLLKKKSYRDMDTDLNNNAFKIGGECVKLRKIPARPAKTIEPFRLPERKPLKRVDPKLLIRKKYKSIQVPTEYQDEAIPEYDHTEITELNFKVEKTVLQKFEKKGTTIKRVKREKYVKEQLKQFKKDPPKEKKKKPEPVIVKKVWKREPKPEPKVEAPPQVKVIKIVKRPVLRTKPKRFIKFEVKTTRKEEYIDEITLLQPKDEILKFKGKEDQSVTFTIKLGNENMSNNSDGFSNCESVDVYETIKL